jgi:hypothetical protein
MRDYKFRGKRIDNGDWVYGSLLIDNPQSKTYIVDNEIGALVDVIPETIGQFTGLTDEYKHELYDGDIVTWGNPEVTAEIFFDDGCFKTCIDGDYPVPLIDALNGLCWVGTKYNNPELLKED